MSRNCSICNTRSSFAEDALDYCKSYTRFFREEEGGEIIKAEFTQDPDKRDYMVSSEKLYQRGFSCEYDLDDGVNPQIDIG